MSQFHTLSVLVQNRPGVLARIAGLFARRGFNIESLAVGPTEDPAYSRVTIVIEAESEQVLEQITKQLNKLVEVIRILEFAAGEAVRRELILVKVRADARSRSQLMEIATMFRGRIVDVAPESIVIEATGSYSKIRALLELLEPYGVRELVQSGSVALGRGVRAITDRSRYDKTPKAERA
ncbi:MAG: acetolactate synthase small subunit [Actinomycetia bacterium]|nr:acetolactate synthase small subunit [Actinomycetes bacterium]